MGRKKRGYKAPEGLVKIPRSKYWYIKRTVFGKNIFCSTGTDDIVQAQQIYHLVMTDILKDFNQNQANKILGKSVPFSLVADRYLKEISPSKSKNGRNDIISSKPVLKHFGDMKIDTITPQDVYKYMDARKNTISERTEKKLSGSTVNREKSFLSEVFTKAVRWGYAETNPLRDIEGFSENKRERYLSDEELSGILNNMREEHRDIFLSIYHTAQRNGRIYNLQWAQINLEERLITFKNTSRNKRVPDVLWINDSLYEILLKRKKNRRVLSPYVFYNKNMRPYNDSNIRKAWHDACDTAQVKGARPYDLRHKAITDMKKAGHGDPFVGKVAGHSDPRTTQRYTHFSAEDTMAPLSALAAKRFSGR